VTENKTQNVHPFLPATREQYWRWGIPSLILAIATIALAATSHWIVEPTILGRYRRNLESTTAEILGNNDVHFSSSHAMQSSPSPAPRSLQEAIAWERKLKRATLIAKRLMLQFPSDPTPKWRLAQLELASHEHYRMLSDIEDDRVTPEQRREWIDRASSARNRATVELREASQLDGEDGQRAVLAVARELLVSGYPQSVPGTIDLNLLIQNIQSKITSTNLQTERRLVLAEIELRRALDCVANHSDDTIDQGLGRAQQWLDQTSLPAETQEARVELLPVDASRLTRATCELWLTNTLPTEPPRRFLARWIPKINDLGKQRVDGISAVCTAFLLLDNAQEALSFVSSRLPNLSIQEQLELRMRVCEIAMEHLVLRAHGKGGEPDTSISRILQFAMQIAPDSPRFQSLVHAVLDRDDATSIARNIRAQLSDVELDAAPVRALRFLEQDWDSSQWTANHTKSIASAGLLSSTVSLLLARVKQGHLDRVKGHQRVILLLETFPQSTDLWIARATLDRNSGDIESAIQALKRARELAPSNKFLEQMLNELQEQAPRTRNERSSSHG
jgi:hypothetical protein